MNETASECETVRRTTFGRAPAGRTRVVMQSRDAIMVTFDTLSANKKGPASTQFSEASTANE